MIRKLKSIPKEKAQSTIHTFFHPVQSQKFSERGNFSRPENAIKKFNFVKICAAINC